MKKSVKALLLVACAIVLVVATVFTTLAFLQATTKNITNTFTVGAVSITLDETKVDTFGAPVVGDGAGRVAENQIYKMVPGNEITKDPKVTINVGSENSYVFIKVVNGLTGFMANNCVVNEEIWADVTTEVGYDGVDGARIYYYDYDGNGAAEEQYVFEDQTFTIDGNIDASTLGLANNSTISIQAYAIQKEGVETKAAAWAEVKDMVVA